MADIVKKYVSFEDFKMYCEYRSVNINRGGKQYNEFCGANGMECRDAICPFVIKINGAYEKR